MVNHYSEGDMLTDVHLELEKKFAEFLHYDKAVLYSLGYSTISSAILAYSIRNDTIFW